MRIPDIRCRIRMTCPVNLSEDPQKIMQAISNIFPFSETRYENFTVTSQSKELRSLERIHETVSSTRSQRSYARNLEGNLEGETTWFLLNKQAAFVGKVAICEEAGESPLGPIKVILSSSDIGGIIDWLGSANWSD